MGPPRLGPKRSLKPGLTVDERRQMNGGYMTGPGNRMAAAAMPGMEAALGRAPRSVAPMGMPPPPGGGMPGLPGGPPVPPMPEGGQGEAPNLREGESGHECMTCDHFETGEGRCELYDFHPLPTEVCDSFAMQSAKMPEDDGMSRKGRPPRPGAY